MLMEIPIALVLLSRVLKYRANRSAIIIAGVIKTIVMLGTLLMGGISYYYIFFATIEIATTIVIIWFAWTWTRPRILATKQKNEAIA
jgi:uncharacterized membrane protein